MGLPIFLLVALTLVSSCHAESDFHADNPLRQRLTRDPAKINCQSFRLGVEANNIQDFETVPDYCTKYLESYYSGNQFTNDVQAMVNEALDLVVWTPFPDDPTTEFVWVFDLDDTLISNLDFFKSSYGGKPVNYTALYEWIASENCTAPRISAVRFLYTVVLEQGYQVVIISESPESLADVRTKHLLDAGYTEWSALMFRGNDEKNLTNYEFKAKKVRELQQREVPGGGRYRVVASVGDQWTDLTIPHEGQRTFKVPNPLYYVK